MKKIFDIINLILMLILTAIIIKNIILSILNYRHFNF